MFTPPKKYSYSLDVAREIYEPVQKFKASYYASCYNFHPIGQSYLQYSPGPDRISAAIRESFMSGVVKCQKEDLVLIIPILNPKKTTKEASWFYEKVDEWLKKAFYYHALFGVPVYDMAILDDVTSLPAGSKLAVIQFMSKELYEQLKGY
jgi:hypothetical protein